MQDLFDNYDQLPQEIQDIFLNHPDDVSFEMNELLLSKLNPLGYSCDFGMDGVAENLRKLFDPASEGWLQTDGSTSTLQYGRKINETTWQYRQWCDSPDEKGYDLETKLDYWEGGKWETDIINTDDYSNDDIESALRDYGYKVVNWNNLKITDNSNNEYTHEDSIQLACECLFEQGY